MSDKQADPTTQWLTNMGQMFASSAVIAQQVAELNHVIALAQNPAVTIRFVPTTAVVNDPVTTDRTTPM